MASWRSLGGQGDRYSQGPLSLSAGLGQKGLSSSPVSEVLGSRLNFLCLSFFTYPIGMIITVPTSLVGDALS